MRDISWDDAAVLGRVRRGEPVGMDAVYAEHVRRMDRIAARIDQMLSTVERRAKGAVA